MPLPSTMTPIATNTLVSATNSITFSSIPQGYTDLILIHSNISGTTQQLRLTFNGDSGSNYSTTELYGTGSAAGSGFGNDETKINIGFFNASAVSNSIVSFQNYSNTNAFKTLIGRYNNAANQLAAVVGLWRSTAAITSITIVAQTGNFAVDSSFTLYGIKAA
jgi:hypothetical protein